jgi:glucose/arabinose dehydrogenase
MLELREGRRHARAAAVACLAALVAIVPAPVRAATLPSGFTETLIAQGLSSPTAMQFAPDGRLFVCQQGGALRVIKNGALLATPFVTISVDPQGERGLLGVAFDPNFAANQYVYVYYTTSTAPVHNRISRFTANGDVAVAGSEVVIVDLDNLSTTASNHNGGAIDFGLDGKLYVAVGDNANTSYPQSLSTRHGKMLRINADGSIPSDNPSSFPGISGATSGIYRSIWAVGLRNPFTFAVNPNGAAPAVMINDVGAGSWEEVNPAAAGSNLGWPTTEGDFNPATYPNFTRPRYAYSSAVNPECAITGGTFYNPATATFPAAYIGTYFFADFCAGWIKRIDPTQVLPWPGLATPIDFATGISSPVDLKVGPDGNLYYLARGNGRVYRVQYGNTAPTISNHPANVTVQPGQPATFSVTASGAGTLTYQWQRNNVNVAGATSASYTLTNPQLSDNGASFRVNVANAFGNVFSNAAVLTVSANQPPVATITAPSASLLYTGGLTVAFAGTGTDPEDGARPASAFTWQVDFHHDTHSHPFMPPTSGITSGSFVVPTSGETSANVWYRIYLTVSDSQGVARTVQRDIFPQRVRLTLTTSPAGLQVLLDGQPVTAPVVVDSVVGLQRTIDAPEQNASGVSYGFVGWSDGGAQARAIATPAVDTTYTATYRALGASSPPSSPTRFTAVVNGATVSLTWDRAAGAQNYRLEAGSASGLADLANVDLGDVNAFQALVPAGTYFVRVRAVNALGVSGPSNQVTVNVATGASCTTAPPAPAGFTGQAGGLLAAFAWQASPSATSYVLEAGVSVGGTIFSASLGPSTTFLTTGPAGTYYTRVRAANPCGVSAPSVELPITLGCSSMAIVPANLAVTKVGGIATFSWLPPLGATSFRLQAGTSAGSSNAADTDVGAVTSLAIGLGGVPPGTYYVRVAAVSACGVGGPSNEVVVTVP